MKTRQMLCTMAPIYGTFNLLFRQIYAIRSFHLDSECFRTLIGDIDVPFLPPRIETINPVQSTDSFRNKSLTRDMMNKEIF